MVRHCEAMGNVKRLFQGSSDFDISELGAIQLEFLSKRFQNTPIDRIYSSPLKRAVKTAEAIAKNKGIPVETLDGLKELHGGIVEGKPFAEVFGSDAALADTWDNHPQDFAPEGGETMKSAYKRIWETVKEIAKSNKDKTVVCTSHGGVIRCLSCRLKYGDINRLKDVAWSENTAVSLIEFDSSLNPSIIYLNNHTHLPEEYLNQKTRLAAFMKGSAK